MPQKFTFSLDHNLASGAIQLDPSAHPELAASIAANDSLPAGDNLIEGADLQVAPGQNIAVGPAKVGFSADVNAALGVYSTPGNARAELLKNAGLVSQISDAIALPQGDRLLLLRWGYDLSGTASGSLALAPAANVSFSASGETKGYFAIMQGVGADAKGLDSLTRLVASWKLPSQVDSIDKLPESTMLLSEVDGSFSLGAKATFGYNFNWVRAVNGLGLKGDVGLKLQAGLTASLGFGMTGKYAVLLVRETAARKMRMRLYKLRVSNLDLGLDASLIVTPQAPAPNSLDDLVKAVTGTHQQQIMKLLGDVRDWADPSKPVFGPFVNLVDGEAQKLLQSVTGVADLSAAFDTVKGRIQKLFNLWNSLPHTAAGFLWSKLPDQQAIGDAAAIAKQVSALSPAELTSFIQSKLPDIPFLNTSAGKMLESLAANGLFAAIQDSEALSAVKNAATTVSGILDGSELEKLLTKLQAAIDTKLDLKQLETVVDQASFDSLDTWLKARLESFLEQDLVGAQGLAELQKLREGLHSILTKADDWYKKALAAVRHNYSFEFNATYQRTATASALLDVLFDFDAAGSQANQGLQLALGGKFDQLLATPLAGVSITDGVLAYGLHHETHVSLALPYFSTTSVHVNDSVAQLEVVSADEGGLIFGLKATDTYTVKNDYSSALTIGLSAPGRENQVKDHGQTASYRYDLKVGIKSLTAAGLTRQFGPYAAAYFADGFQPASPGRFADWANLIAPEGGRFGNSLVSLSVSLASSAAGAWMKAPDSQSDPIYKKMSMALQREFKQVLHDVFFSDISKYNDVSGDTAARAVLVFCAIPACSDAELMDNGGKVVFLDEKAPGKTIYWDYRDRGSNIFSVDLREKVLFAPETQANLLNLLQVARQRLKDAGDPDGRIGFYADNQLGAILGAALHGKLLDFLFPVEADLVEQARGAGIKMAAFRKAQFARPDAARKDLASFGEKLSSGFHSNLQNFAVGAGLLPLGTAIYLSGAMALDDSADDARAAMLTVQMLRAGVDTLTPADTDVLHTARVVHGTVPMAQGRTVGAVK
jgi:hypothetical protein